MALSTTIGASSSSYDVTKNFALRSLRTVNEANIDIDKSQPLPEWKLPMVSSFKIYKGLLPQHLMAKSCIKVKEQVKSIKQNSNELVPISIFDSVELRKIKIEHPSYKYIHLGMLQVPIYPLTRRGLNTSYVYYVYDYRHNKFVDSLCGAIQSTLNDGPITLIVYPNFLVSLSDDHLDKVLKVLIKTHGFDIKIGSTYLAIQTRIMYRYVNTLFPIVHHDTTIDSSVVIKIDLTLKLSRQNR